MVRLAFISDVHGNAVALEAVLADIKQKSVDKVYVLGDLCFRGSEPNRSLNLIRSMDAEVIKGNADEWIVRGIREGEVPEEALRMMRSERDWSLSKLDDDSVQYLNNLPTELNISCKKVNIHAFHATPNSLFDVVQPSESYNELIKKIFVKDVDIYIYAHIHKAYIKYTGGKCIINSGSVGMPFDGLNQSSYAIVDINESYYTTSIVRVGYDVNKVIQQFKESNYPNAEFMINILEHPQGL